MWVTLLCPNILKCTGSYRNEQKITVLPNKNAVFQIEDQKNASNLHPTIMSNRPPVLSFKVAKEYFDLNLSGHISDFELDSDGLFYERTIQQDELSLSFNTESDCEYLLCISLFYHEKFIFQMLLSATHCH